MAKKLIDLHWEWMKRERLPEDGLCNSLPAYYLYLICDNSLSPECPTLLPTDEDKEVLRLDNLSTAYWGSGVGCSSKGREYCYTELRQNIVLFICAICGEI